MTQPNTDYDNPWKSIIELYFRDFISFFFPWITPDIDWSRPIRFLDKELQKVVRVEEARQMKYVTSIERMAEERGIEEGREEERRSIALNMLRKTIPLETIAELTGLTIAQLQQLQVDQSQ